MRQLLCDAFMIAAAAILTLSCGSAAPTVSSHDGEPFVDQPGRNMVRYRDRVIEVVVDSEFAARNLAEEWLILNVAVSGMTGAATVVDRDLVWVRTPDGRSIPLPPYEEFNAAFGDLASLERRAVLASKPLDFTRGGRRACAINFMPRPGSGIAANRVVYVRKYELCSGLLYFPIPGGVQQGAWRLIIDFEESRAIVPFTLELD